MYNPVTGQQQLWEWNAASKTWGLFAEDTWKARKNLTLTLGFRFDDQGNPYSRSASTVFGNFYLGSGSTFQERVINGIAKPTHNALLRSPKTFNPRAGFAWDVDGNGSIEPYLTSPLTYIYAATLERKIANNLVASILYSGSHSSDLIANGNQAGAVSYGADINAKPGDLLSSPTRTSLNPNFGAINY